MTFLLPALCFIATLTPTYAQTFAIRITEIMYDAPGSDTGKEYIEIANVGDAAIPTASISFTEHGRTHAVRAAEPVLLPPGAVAILSGDPAVFTETYGDDGHILLSSGTFSLNNTGSEITVAAFGFTHTVTYTAEDGGAGDGTSLEVTANGTVRPRPPTPGTARNLPTVRRQPEPEPVPDTAVTLRTDPATLFSASETTFSVMRDGTVLYGSWNFGDGMVTTGRAVRHAYIHPGTRLLVFEEIPVGAREDTDEPVTLQQEVTIIRPQLRAERMDDTFVRVYNDHGFTLNVPAGS